MNNPTTIKWLGALILVAAFCAHLDRDRYAFVVASAGLWLAQSLAGHSTATFEQRPGHYGSGTRRLLPSLLPAGHSRVPISTLRISDHDPSAAHCRRLLSGSPIWTFASPNAARASDDLPYRQLAPATKATVTSIGLGQFVAIFAKKF